MNTIEAMHHYVEMMIRLDEADMLTERDLIKAEFTKLFKVVPVEPTKEEV